MTDWRRFRELVRPDLTRIISQDKLSDKDYCDLKIILSDLERSYTIEMFEDQEREKEYSGYRYPHGRINAYYDNVAGRNPGYSSHGYDTSGRYAPYHQHIEQGYSGHNQAEDFKSRLQEMYHTADNAETRRVIQDAMDKLR